MTGNKVILYGIANCDTIRKTRQWLADRHVSYCFHDYRKDGLDADLAERILTAVPLEELINKRGTTWRSLPAQVQTQLSPRTAAALMRQHPALIRRPLMQIAGRWIAGYDEKQFTSLLDGLLNESNFKQDDNEESKA